MPAGWRAAGILPAVPVCQGDPLPDGRQTTPGDLASPGEVIQPHHGLYGRDAVIDRLSLAGDQQVGLDTFHPSSPAWSGSPAGLMGVV